MLKRIIIILFFFIVVGGCLEETNNLLNAEKIINNSQERYGSIDVFKYTVISTTEFQGEEVTQKIDFLFKKCFIPKLFRFFNLFHCNYISYTGDPIFYSNFGFI